MPSIYINESDASGQDQLFISNIYSGKILGEIMRLQDKIVNITQNGTQEVTYDSNYAGLNKVTINTNVPNPSTGTINITTNDTYDVTEKARAVVNVPNPSSGSLSITENGTYDVTEKASAVVNVQGGQPGLPINITSNCPSPFLLNQNNLTSNVKYIFPTTTASVANVNEDGEEIVAARDFTAYSKNSAATSAFTITYANDENTISSNGVSGYERIGYSVTLSAGESITFVTKYKCDGTLQTSGSSPNAPFMFVGESTVLNNTDQLFGKSNCLSCYAFPLTAASYEEYNCSYTNDTSSSKTVIVGLDFGSVRNGITAVTYFKNVRLTKFAVSGSISVGDEVKTKLSHTNDYANFTYQWQNAANTIPVITSTGTQYIDTGIVPTNHEVVAKFKYTEATNDSCIFGVTSTTYHLTWYPSRWYYACGSGESSFNGTQCTNLQVVDFNNANNKVVMNGVEYASTNGTVSVSRNLTIFGRGGASTQSKAKLYYLKIYDRSTNTLVRDFVPAISQESGHENAVCLYDNVTQTYFYNQGSGVFVYEQEGDFTDISGATSSTYTAQTGDNAILCILTGTGNAEGTITSSSIEVQEVD